MEQMRDFTFMLRAGFSSPIKKSSRIVSSALPFTSYCKLMVNLSVSEQMSIYHPILVKRLEKDWGKRLSSLRCSTGDFGLALREGQVSLGHVTAEIYCLCLDYVTDCLHHGHVDFDERFIMETDSWTPEVTYYRIRLFFSEKLPPQFSGLEHMVIGYLNAAFEDKPFDIHKKLDQFVEYRSNSRRRKKPIWWRLITKLLIPFYWLFALGGRS